MANNAATITMNMREVDQLKTVQAVVDQLAVPLAVCPHQGPRAKGEHVGLAAPGQASATRNERAECRWTGADRPCWSNRLSIIVSVSPSV
jgi:hypothetical protein